MNRVIKIGLMILTAVLLALLVATPLVGGNYMPKSVNGEDLQNEITESILSVEQGFYNSYLPIFATKIEFVETSEDYLLYRVYYFPFGSIERSYTREPDGNWIFNLEKPLFGIS